jgi:mono/diheme cytochrome c family protein
MKLNTMPLAPVFMALLFVSLSPPGSSGQTTGQKNPPLVMTSMYGRDLFEFYCATCHGRDGKGGGPSAPALIVPPPDLTTIATRNGGIFSRARVEGFVTGDQERLMSAHGSKDMPVWGPIFRALDPNDMMNKIRIANIVEYIESIQEAK